MQLYKWYIVSLFLIVQIVAGCGGGGGGGTAPPPVADTTAPTVNSFTLSATAASLTVSVTGFSATDLVGVTGYLITENSTTPAASAVGWTATAPTTFTFSSGGSKTAYAWAKDSAGNVSSSRAASTTITLPTTKTATLKFTSQSTNSNELIGGFLLTVILPAGSVLSVDSSGVPLTNSVFLSGQFSGISPLPPTPSYCPITYVSASRTLTVNPASAYEYRLGEFTTVRINVPYSYLPNTNDVITTFTAWSPSGVQSVTATATFTFN